MKGKKYNEARSLIETLVKQVSLSNELKNFGLTVSSKVDFIYRSFSKLLETDPQVLTQLYNDNHLKHLKNAYNKLPNGFEFLNKNPDIIRFRGMIQDLYDKRACMTPLIVPVKTAKSKKSMTEGAYSSISPIHSDTSRLYFDEIDSSTDYSHIESLRELQQRRIRLLEEVGQFSPRRHNNAMQTTEKSEEVLTSSLGRTVPTFSSTRSEHIGLQELEMLKARFNILEQTMKVLVENLDERNDSNLPTSRYNTNRSSSFANTTVESSDLTRPLALTVSPISQENQTNSNREVEMLQNKINQLEQIVQTRMANTDQEVSNQREVTDLLKDTQDNILETLPMLMALVSNSTRNNEVENSQIFEHSTPNSEQKSIKFTPVTEHKSRTPSPIQSHIDLCQVSSPSSHAR